MRKIIFFITMIMTLMLKQEIVAAHENNGNYLLVVASLRKNSINRQLMNLVIDDLKSKKIPFEILDLNLDLPSYNEDNTANNLGTVQKLAKTISQSKAIIISSPEYNKSIPGFFKNILDWISVVEKQTFEAKPTMLLAVSPSNYSGVLGLADLQKVLMSLGAYVFPKRIAFTNRDSIKSKQILKIELQQHRLLLKTLEDFYKYADKLTHENPKQ